MAYFDWCNKPWYKSEKEACQELDKIDLNPYLDRCYSNLKDIINNIKEDYPELGLKVFSALSEEEFKDYLEEHYKIDIFSQAEFIVTYWIKRVKE